MVRQLSSFSIKGLWTRLISGKTHKHLWMPFAYKKHPYEFGNRHFFVTVNSVAEIITVVKNGIGMSNSNSGRVVPHKYGKY